MANRVVVILAIAVDADAEQMAELEEARQSLDARLELETEEIDGFLGADMVILEPDRDPDEANGLEELYRLGVDEGELGIPASSV